MCDVLLGVPAMCDKVWYFCGARPVLTLGATPMRSKGNRPRPGFGFSALPVLQYGILLFFLGLAFPILPIHSTSDLGSYLHSLYLRVGLPSQHWNFAPFIARMGV